jgi:hypothetical protein
MLPTILEVWSSFWLHPFQNSSLCEYIWYYSYQAISGGSPWTAITSSYLQLQIVFMIFIFLPQIDSHYRIVVKKVGFRVVLLEWTFHSQQYSICVSLSKLHNHITPQSPCLKNEDNNYNYFTKPLWALNYGCMQCV